MKLFKNIAVVGTGLIGGSIALGIKKKHIASKVIGVSRTARTLRLAKNSGAIDTGSLDIGVIKGADLVILATPVGTILDLAPKISKIIARDTLVTDVGSSKAQIVARLEKLFPKYVGSHPLAGSEKRGIDFACPEIFKNSLCILTPTSKSDAKAIEKIKKFWQALGARVSFLSPNSHDTVLSFVSHLPHAAAFALIHSVPRKYLKFASCGLRDTTRIAASDDSLWSDIFFSNRKNTIEALDLLEGSLRKIKTAIKNNDAKLLKNILKEAKEKRELL